MLPAAGSCGKSPGAAAGAANRNCARTSAWATPPNVDIVRIEWPSGVVQTLTNIAPKQFLTVIEHQEPGPTNAPLFTSVSRSTNGAVNLSTTGRPNLRYLFEASTNLVNWSWLGVRTNLTGTIEFTDAHAAELANRFYRVSIP